MKSIFLWAFLLFYALQTHGQTITGKVYRQGTDNVIAGASVYYGGSMRGTATDDKGNFRLQAQSQQIPVIVSCVGYYSSTVYYETGKPLVVYLKPKMEDIRTVTIRADGMNRKDEIARFIREFLGTSGYALSCTIENLDDINLFYDRKAQILTGDCEKPIIIHNKKLGYTIIYYLDKFKDTPEEVTFSGNYIFKEDSIDNDKNRLKIAANREDAYEGSRMQFIRALWHNMLGRTRFKIFIDSWDNQVSAKSIVIDSVNKKYIHFEGKLLITNSTGPRQNSIVNQNEKYSFIDKSGYFGLGLQWWGPMSNQRIGDLLPFEYQSKKEIKLYGESDADLLQPVPPSHIATASAKPADTITVVEKTYLHTDRDVYTQGEDIWFKAYLVNGRDNMPTINSRLLHVELIDPQNKIVASRLLRLEDGLGNGDFRLADTISPGVYRIRAYTNWMRNFGDDFIFEKNIRILGTAKASITAITTKKKHITATIATSTVTNSAPTVRFFPEGGSMINGLTGIVAVRAEDSNGHGVAVTGNVINNEDETVASFICDSLGFGAFTLLPDIAQHYQALATIHGENSRFILPQVLPEGFTMNVQNVDRVTKIRITCNESVLNKAKGQQFLITAKHGGQIRLKKVIPLNSGQLLVNIPDELLPEGISVITLSDEKAQPLCERLIYNYRRGANYLSVSTDKAGYQPKEQVTVRFKLNEPGTAYLSLAAVDANTVPVQPENIISYLNLQSEVRGGIEDAERYFDTTNINRFKQMDLLLLTQGWRNFVWKQLEDTTLKLTYKAEQGIDITGRVRRVGANKPLPGINVVMNDPNMNGQKSFTTITDSVGRFIFRDMKFYGYQYINFFARKVNSTGVVKDDSGGLIQVDSLFQNLPPVKAGQVLANSTYNDSEELSIIETLRRRLNLKADHNLKEVKIRASSRSGTRDLTPQIHQITLAEHKDYTNVAQYLLYMINGVKLVATDCWRCGIPVRYTQKGTPVQIHDSGNSRLITSVAIRGVYSDHSPVDTCVCQDDYLIQPLQNVLKVTISPFLDMSGIIRYKVDLILRPGVLEVKNYFDNTMADMVGYYRAREFYKPRFENANDMDTRTNTIHWEPNITTDEKGEATVSFYNTPQVGDIRLIMQGMAANGTPLAVTTTYRVK